jgi:hypothetical protein
MVILSENHLEEIQPLGSNCITVHPLEVGLFFHLMFYFQVVILLKTSFIFASYSSFNIWNTSILTRNNVLLYEYILEGSVDAIKDTVNPSAEPLLSNSIVPDNDVDLRSTLSEARNLRMPSYDMDSPQRHSKSLSPLRGIADRRHDEPGHYPSGDHREGAYGQVRPRDYSPERGRLHSRRQPLEASRSHFSSRERAREALGKPEYSERRVRPERFERDVRYEEGRRFDPQERHHRNADFDRERVKDVDWERSSELARYDEREKLVREKRTEPNRDSSAYPARLESSSEGSMHDLTVDAYNLSFMAKEYEIREFFEVAGPVKVCKLIMDNNTGRFRGYAHFLAISVLLLTLF